MISRFNKATKTFKMLIMPLLVIFVLFTANSVFADVNLVNPLGKNPADADPRILIGRLIKGILGLSGSIALLIFIYGGLVYLTAQGERERIERGKNTLIWATMGIVVIFGSYAFLSYVFKGLGQAT